ncbi:hypothetical protein [Nannocystis pusilla]|uniref:hypothetical protein n=1 Tax=Nannocystis pusilla TaxID=889268 RepID=UPI003B7F9D43
MRFLLAWTAAAMLAAATGLRFYKGYWLGVLPPLCLLAAAPWAAGAPALWRRGWPRLIVAPLVLALTMRAAWALRLTRDDRARPHDEGARAIGRWLGERTGPDDTIWVWGWHLWGVHAYSGRLSASRIYKTLGLLTTTPDDTWRTPAGPAKVLTDGPAAQQLLSDLTASPRPSSPSAGRPPSTIPGPAPLPRRSLRPRPRPPVRQGGDLAPRRPLTQRRAPRPSPSGRKIDRSQRNPRPGAVPSARRH